MKLRLLKVVERILIIVSAILGLAALTLATARWFVTGMVEEETRKRNFLPFRDV